MLIFLQFIFSRLFFSVDSQYFLDPVLLYFVAEFEK